MAPLSANLANAQGSRGVTSVKDGLAGGYTYLERTINRDGGLPAVSESDVSGVWTTAEALEAFCLASYFPNDRFSTCQRMWQFLSDNQMTGHEAVEGSWPLVKGGQRGSAMATGHAVAGIFRASSYFGERLPSEVLKKADKGISWLERYQSNDGGWGVEPATPPHGTQSRMISTVYAVYGLVASGQSVETSETLRKAKNWILSMRARGGSFRGGVRHEPDACNTARALRALIEMRAATAQDEVIQAGLKYIRRQRQHDGTWVTAIESFVIEGTSGEVVFNSNTPADVFYILSLLTPSDRVTHETADWFLRTQNSTGCWFLYSKDGSRSHVGIWSTSEALRALDTYDFMRSEPAPLEQVPKWPTRIIVALSLVVILQAALLLRFNELIYRAWLAIPASVRTLILTSIILAILVNLFSNYTYDIIRRLRARR